MCIRDSPSARTTTRRGAQGPCRACEAYRSPDARPSAGWSAFSAPRCAAVLWARTRRRCTPRSH
eukprot:5626137-Prymnesium_polylepis.1